MDPVIVWMAGCVVILLLVVVATGDWSSTRHRLAIWWHRHIKRHTIGPTKPLVEIPSPWDDFPEFTVGTLWVTQCIEDECFWVRVELVPNRKVLAP